MRSLSLWLLLVFSGTVFGATVRIEFPVPVADVEFGVQELQTALRQRGHRVVDHGEADQVVRVALDPNRAPQSFHLRPGPTTRAITAGDAAGVTYGLLELAEQIRLFDLTGVTATAQAPAQPVRGIKFNLPLDVRTPTYSESGAAAQHALPEVWDRAFWYAFIDQLARHRYNLISLWNLHPFPSLVRVPEYPEVALDDVRRSTVRWEGTYALQATDFGRPEIVDQYETLRTLTMDQKIAFWRDILAYARSRHIQVYVVTWNIFVNGTAGRYGITDDIHNPVTRDYFRASVRSLFHTYPDLAGIGLTTGEAMAGATFEEKEDWAFATYGQGVLDVARAEPDRRITFIHRQHQTRARDIARTFQPLIDAPNVDFRFSFKYAEAHVMSATRQPFADQFIRDIPPLQTLWTLRNDDNYLFRWGGADFVREFVQGLPAAVSAGVYYGSDQWVWAREFISREPEHPRELELTKHWYHWLLWGRLSYDPSLSNERLVALIGERFPGVDAGALFEAWQQAAMVYPLTTGFHWGALDFQWYIEACQSLPLAARTPTGFHDLNRFISLPPHPATDNQSIPDFVAATVAGRTLPGTSPFEVAAQLQQRADAALAAVARVDARGQRELRQTLEDIQAQAYLGYYYAHKIRGATLLALLRVSLQPRYRDQLAPELNQAAQSWRRYAATADALYRLQPLRLNRVGFVDLADNYQSVLYDLTIAGVEPAIPSIEPTPGGTVLEAEDAATSLPRDRTVAGFTGTGYVAIGDAEGAAGITWTYDAPAAGTYLLEFRHLQRWGGARSAGQLEVNGMALPDFRLIHSGTSTNWVWDRVPAVLRAGPNTLTLRPGGSPLIDHLNVLPTGY